ATTLEAVGYRYSYDMLGEMAHTSADALRYFQAYEMAIREVAKANGGRGPIDGPGISVKLSALHPRYHELKAERVMTELLPRLKSLARQAKEANIGFTIDAEEVHRLMISLDLIEDILFDPEFSEWTGIGLAVQAYQKRATAVVDWLIDLARRRGTPFTVRLVKGAYWDTEIKDSQVNGYDYPVFTRKITTDVSYLVCAKKLLAARSMLYPQFATHNAHTVATVFSLAGDNQGYEFQCLHGMGEALYQQVVGANALNVPCRIYAPIGSHEDLLPYLVRRLLENGANSSFVNRIVDERLPIEEIIADPVAKLQRIAKKPHPLLQHPRFLFGEDRLNSAGLDVPDRLVRHDILASRAKYDDQVFQAHATLMPEDAEWKKRTLYSPAQTGQMIGEVTMTDADFVSHAVQAARQAQGAWMLKSVIERAACLDKLAELLEEHRPLLLSLLAREGGKTLADALSEVREAVDFCRYYAALARKQCVPTPLVGPTGETNHLTLLGRGVFVCISPWNFPLAIFTGQVVAALVTGNAVLAKPADQTPLIAAQVMHLIHEAGVPKDVAQLMPGSGSTVGQAMIAHPQIDGVMFTGSTAIANHINTTLAAKNGTIVPFIAETGGQNAMIVDSSALAEQVVVDAMQSAFYSAGQRCSALRVLYVQEEIADKVWHMMTGCMAELQLGNPLDIITDIGPVIDAKAKQSFEAHIQQLRPKAKNFYQISLKTAHQAGHFFAPTVLEIDSIHELSQEVFGPVLHMIRYSSNNLDGVVEDINGTGYGLTFGIHSRIQETIRYLCD
ncbi:MAG: bifunctional proline dehydrogenase/L-glutamate gamma-semialdehyde dehydrogenase PutA, partial [Pseudomonadota bacterium]